LHINQKLHGCHFVAADADQRLFMRKGEKGILVLVAYVDDFEVFGPNASKALDTAGAYLQ
jgi:hypothetical protein